MPSRTIEYGVVLGAKRQGQQAYRQTQRDLRGIERYAQRVNTGFRVMGRVGARALAAIGRTVANVARRLWNMARMAVVAGAVIAEEIGRRALNAFADYEQAVVNALTVTGLVGDAFTEARAKLSDFGLALAQQSNKMATEIADGFYALASAGLSIDEVMRTMPGVLALAEGTLADMGLTTELVTSTMKMFRLNAEDTDRIVNALAATIGKSRMNMTRLAVSLPYVGAAAAEFGLQLEDTLAALALLVNRGLDASMAGTQLRMTLYSLLNVSKENQKALARYGLSVADLNIKTHGLVDVMQKLQKLPPDLLAKIFGVRAAGAVMILRRNIEEYARLREQITGTNRAYDMQQQQLNTLQGQWRSFVGDVQKLSVEFARGINPSARGFVDILRNIAQQISQAGWAEQLGRRVGAVVRGVLNALRGLWASFGTEGSAKEALGRFVKQVGDALMAGFGDVITRVKAFINKLGAELFGGEEQWQKFVEGLKNAFVAMAEAIIATSRALVQLAPILARVITRIANFVEKHPYAAMFLAGAFAVGKPLAGGALQALGGQAMTRLLGGGAAAGGAEVAGGGAAGGWLGRVAPWLGRVGGVAGRAIPAVAVATTAYDVGSAAYRGWQQGGPEAGLGERAFGAYRHMVDWGLRFASGVYPSIAGYAYRRWGSPYVTGAGQYQAAGGYGSTIVIQTNDERRIGELAQREYERARGRQRTQLVR